jgi:hypothetical protein
LPSLGHAAERIAPDSSATIPHRTFMEGNIMRLSSSFRRIVVAIAVFATPAAAQPYVPHLHPQLTSQEIARLQAAPKGACVPAASIAASAIGGPEGSSGTDSIVEYPTIITNEGSGFVNGDSFIAPCGGMYTLSVSFNTDSYDVCPTQIGTQDDVEVYFVRSTPPLYNDTHYVGSDYGAWRGQLSDDQKRGEASYTLVIRLNAGDAIQTKVHSDGNVFRCLWRANFSAVREAK